MKNKFLYKISITVVLSLVILFSISGCKKYNDWEVDESTRRLFSPSQLTGVIQDGVSAMIGWMPVSGAASYTIELSKDSLTFENIVGTFETEGEKLVEGSAKVYKLISELDSRTRYSVRVKAKTASVDESKWAAVTFLTESEQIMYNVGIEDIAPRAATLKWLVPNNVTHFIINEQRYDISAAEKQAGEKLIENLLPKTLYSATLYNNAAIRGSQTFATKADIPTGSNVVEVAATDNLAAMLAEPIIPGTIFVLLQGSVYKADASIALPTDASFTIWGEDGPQKPVLAFNGINLPASAGTIRFENLDITGYQDVTSGTKRNYVFNQSAASNTEAIEFENCIVRNFVNTPFRTQGNNGIYVSSLTFNNCIVYDIGDNNSNGTYALIHNGIGANTGRIDNINITNSTLYNIGYSIIVSSNAPSQNVIIENNTFYNVVGNGRYFIDYNAQLISGSFRFNNNIIGKTLSPAGSARGIRSGSTGNLILSSSYQCSDVVFTSNGISGISSYSGTSADLFTSPESGIFTIKDNEFGGRTTSGDPRWRP